MLLKLDGDLAAGAGEDTGWPVTGRLLGNGAVFAALARVGVEVAGQPMPGVAGEPSPKSPGSLKFARSCRFF